MAKLDDFELLVWDCEVFKEDWLFVIKDQSGSYHEFWNDPEGLQDFMDEHADSVFVGFNSKHYDSYIAKAILNGAEPDEVKSLNDWIIAGNTPWEHYTLDGFFYNINNTDLMDDMMRGTSLKSIEAHLGMSIEETTVDFDVDHALDSRERDEVIRYCRYDVDATERLMGIRRNYLETKLHLAELAEVDPVKALGMTDPKLAAALFKAEAIETDDERAYEFPDWLDYDYIPNDILAFFRRVGDESVSDEELFSESYETTIGGCPMTYKFGGVHGALPKYREEATSTRLILNYDVSSLYPSLMIEHGYVSRAVPDPAIFSGIRDERFAAKKRGDTQTANALKSPMNKAYGAMGNEYNPMYDPKNRLAVCISGQLALTELMVRYTEIDGLLILQANTDGIMVSLPAEHYQQILDINDWWQHQVSFELEEDRIQLVWQKDVNNYAMRKTDGHEKIKGGYLVRGIKPVGAWSINNNATVVADALRAYLLDGTPVADTINACDDPSKFQLIAKAGHKFSRVYQLVADEEVERQRCNRVFACTYEGLGRLYKVKAADGRVAKVESLPDHCLVRNGEYPDVSEIDKQWYIALAEKRAQDFEGARMAESTTGKTTTKRRTSTRAASKEPDFSKMNVYQKLAIARKMFLERGVQRSGTNNSAEYEYFELVDIVPAQTAIFAEVGLLETFTYHEPQMVPVSAGDHWEPHLTEPMAVSTVINVDDPEQTIEFRLKWGEIAPIISKRTGKPVNQPIQNNGGEQTYMRRYLKMQVLDIVEHDAVDDTSREDIEKPAAEPKEKAASATETPISADVSTGTGEKPKATKAPRKRAQKPATQSERKATAKRLTNADGAATPLQVKQLQRTLRNLMDAYGETHAELGAYVTELGAETDNLKSITKARCEQAIRDLGEMKEKFETEGGNE